MYSKNELMDIMSDWLLVLRTALGITQSEIAGYLGMSRQTYLSLENKSHAMSWGNFIILFTFFYTNNRSKILMERKEGYIDSVISLLTVKEDS